MSTLHKVKAYFGMAPMDDYDDEYYEDDDRGTSRGGYSRRPREDRFEDDGYGRGGYDDREYDDAPVGYRGGYRDEDRFEPRMRGPRDFERASSRLGALRGSTRGALAMDPRRMAELFEAGSPLSKITTLRPKDYGEARTIAYTEPRGTQAEDDGEACTVTFLRWDGARGCLFAFGNFGVEAYRPV